MDIRQEQIEKMNLEVKEKLNLTDKEYEKSKDVLSRLNEMDLEANPELYENKQEKNQTENQKKIKELEERKKQAEEEEQLLWITDECDVEAYFTAVEHITAITEKTADEVIEWQKTFLIENHVEIQHKFEEKRKAICATMYNSERKLKKKKEISWPSFETLFGKTVPTSRRNVVGKFMLKKCNENMSKLCDHRIDLLTKTDSLIIASLQDIINKA